MYKQISIPQSLIQATLLELQQAGRSRCERMVVWLGSRNGDSPIVKKMYVPDQLNETYLFEITQAGMAGILSQIRSTRLPVIAQIHSHPREAFHSKADNDLAILRHEGALSFVLPNFALQTTVENFIEHTEVFSLDEQNHWIQLPKQIVRDLVKVYNDEQS